MLGINVDTISLDIEQFNDDPRTYALAQVVSEEAEAQRVIESERAATASQRVITTGRSAGLRLRDLLNPSALAGRFNYRPWYEHLTNFATLERCAVRMGASLPDVIERISKELHPPNWQTLFWMRAFHNANHEHRADLAGIAQEFDQQVQDEAARIVSQSAKKAAGVRHKENRDMQAQAVAWYVVRRDTMSKDEAASQMAGKLVPVKFRTVRDWLKGK